MRKGHRLDLIVRDENTGRFQFARKFLNLQAHLHPQLGIKIRQRLIEQKHRRLPNDGAPHRHTLPLPTREFARFPLQQLSEFKNLRRFLHARLNVVFREFANLQSIRHVFVHRHVRIERVILKHHRDIAILGLQIVDEPAADPYLARRDDLEPRDHAQQRRFAAARWAHDDDELTVGNFGIDTMHHGIFTVGFLDVF